MHISAFCRLTFLPIDLFWICQSSLSINNNYARMLNTSSDNFVSAQLPQFGVDSNCLEKGTDHNIYVAMEGQDTVGSGNRRPIADICQREP